VVALWIAAVGVAAPTAVRAQGAATAATITISGDVPHPVRLTAADLAPLARRTMRASEHGQPEATYEGVPLRDVLERAGVAFGPAMRGHALATYVVCSAPDGYRVVFALAELDSAFNDRTVMLVDRKDGAPLDAHAGPFRIVVPGDARPARWIRQVTACAVEEAPEEKSTSP
jgi:DMSO/TMAO reductase YedYZ molybdopterin-dependent catalytic subunit